MTQFSYDIVDDQYGQKLAISFDYDEQLKNRIKSMPWEETHRRWDPDHEAWTIDYNEAAVEIFEHAVGVMVPPDVRPGDSDGRGTVDFIVPDGYTWFFIQNPRPEVDRLLYQELAYEDPGAEYTDAYKSGAWDGIERLYDRNNHGAPRGLIDRAIDLVEDMGYETSVEIEGDRSGASVDLEWNFPHDLRQYQSDAVTSILAERSGVISLPTGTGKTVTCMKALQMEGQKAIVLVHTQELLYQWGEEIEDALGVEPGLIGDGNWSEGDVTVAIIQTLMSRGTSQLDDDYGVLVFDECHRTSAADQMNQIGMDIDADMRIGLSATPWRSVDGEELKIEGATGGVVYEVTASDMIDQGFLAEPDFEFLRLDRYEKAGRHEDYHDAYRRVIELNPARNTAICERAAQLEDAGYKVLINVDRIKQGKLLEHALNGAISPMEVIEEMEGSLGEQELAEFASALTNLGHIADCDAVFISGRDDSETRQDVLERFENDELNVVVATIMQEGVDVPNINAMIEASAGKSDISQIQVIGRALRPSNGKTAKVVDVEDFGRYFRDQFKQRVRNLADYYGSYGPNPEDFGINPDEVDDGQVDLTEPLSDDEMEEMEQWIRGLGE